MENEPTKLDRILQAMQPEDRERAVNLLQLFREKKEEWESKMEKEEALSENHKIVLKEREEQLKQPIDWELEIARQKLNAKDHASHSEYLAELQELEKVAAFKKDYLEKVQEARREQMKHPLDLERALRQLRENSKD